MKIFPSSVQLCCQGAGRGGGCCHGDGEAEQEDGHDDAEGCAGPALLPLGLEGGGGGEAVLLPDGSGTVWTWPGYQGAILTLCSIVTWILFD